LREREREKLQTIINRAQEAQETQQPCAKEHHEPIYRATRNKRKEKERDPNPGSVQERPKEKFK
jgi:hypothetical protein